MISGPRGYKRAFSSAAGDAAGRQREKPSRLKLWMNLSEVKSGKRIFRDITSLNEEKVCADKDSLNYLTFGLLENSAITVYLEAPNSYLFAVLGILLPEVVLGVGKLSS